MNETNLNTGITLSFILHLFLHKNNDLLNENDTVGK